ncbi:uncharacterized protein LOC112270082 [Brachypodium distachyon]|uniref:uncharacterized protein LOC112270082 n=1 Tax=Brachypodium distachyon TaxID=15368 RepID=UPI000D0CCCC6|nr:uncharacterized protein LOC112270082 [Brachypodium distachyon]|eukprot:XP_024313531.1 uncharacterized protein LOC112270082 [Brachypodium distachyon]
MGPQLGRVLQFVGFGRMGTKFRSNGRILQFVASLGSDDFDLLDYLSIRYRICGKFVMRHGVMMYVGGIIGLYHSDRDKLCYQEIMDFFKDMISVELDWLDDRRQVKIYWLSPGKAVDDGLSLLYDDASVRRMDSQITNGGVAELYVEHFEYESDENENENENQSDADWEPDNQPGVLQLSSLDNSEEEEAEEQAAEEPAVEEPIAEESVGLVNIRLAETYSKQKGTKFPLLPVQAVGTDYVISLLSDAPTETTIEDEMEKLLISPSKEELVGRHTAEEIGDDAKKESSNSKDMTPSKKDLDVELKRFRKIYGYSQEDKKKKVKRTLIPAKPHPSREKITPPEPDVSAAKKSERKESEYVPLETNENEQEAVDDSEEDTDTECVPPECSSGGDSEAEQIRKLAREIRRQKRAKKMGATTGPVVKDNNVVEEKVGDLDVGYDTDYFDSNDDDCSYDEESDGEGGKLFKRRKSSWQRFDSKAEEPTFQLGMVFSGKEQMKKALIKYGIKQHVHCSWPGCKWMIYASKTRKNKWLQVSTLVDEHYSIPIRDNNLVTSQVIAAKYAKLIKANPPW